MAKAASPFSSFIVWLVTCSAWLMSQTRRLSVFPPISKRLFFPMASGERKNKAWPWCFSNGRVKEICTKSSHARRVVSASALEKRSLKRLFAETFRRVSFCSRWYAWLRSAVPAVNDRFCFPNSICRQGVSVFFSSCKKKALTRTFACPSIGSQGSSISILWLWPSCSKASPNQESVPCRGLCSSASWRAKSGNSRIVVSVCKLGFSASGTSRWQPASKVTK